MLLINAILQAGSATNYPAENTAKSQAQAITAQHMAALDIDSDLQQFQPGCIFDSKDV